MAAISIRSATVSRAAGRALNEDQSLRLSMRAPENLWGFASVAAVADGMGGHNAGEVASRIAIETVREVASAGSEGAGQFSESVAKGGAANALQYAVKLANTRILGQAAEDASQRDMGTTLTVLGLHDREAAIAHVGDSRAYRLRRKGIERLTEDHSWVHEQVRDGTMTEEEAKRSPFRSHITRTVGTKEAVEPDLIRVPIRRNELFVLCTDGLTDVVEDEEIESTARSSRSVTDACKRLADLAEKRGTEDNVTVVVVETGRFFQQQAPPAPAAVPASEAETQELPRLVRGKSRPRPTPPASKALLAVGAIVVLVVAAFLVRGLVRALSGGEDDSLEMPDVTDMPFDEAEAMLAETGSLTVESVTGRYDAFVPEGYVIEHNPGPSTRVSKGDRAWIVVSWGSRERSVNVALEGGNLVLSPGDDTSELGLIGPGDGEGELDTVDSGIKYTFADPKSFDAVVEGSKQLGFVPDGQERAESVMCSGAQSSVALEPGEYECWYPGGESQPTLFQFELIHQPTIAGPDPAAGLREGNGVEP